MASISKRANGHRMIQFIGADRQRRSIRLGKVDARCAERVRSMIEALASAQITGFAPPDEVARWAANLDDNLHGKLAAAGLIAGREACDLGPFIDRYIASRIDVKSGTKAMYLQAQKALVEFFGLKKRLRDITPGDAEDWARWMTGKGWAFNTVRKRSAIAKLFFNAAVKKRLIAESPFDELRGAVRPNESRMVFIDRQTIEKVIAKAPDAEWRLIIALARFAGLRTPSETLALRWEDIDWESQRMTVWSPKTAHHAGKEFRRVPLFPELRPYLEEAFEAASEGATFVVERYRKGCKNWRTPCHRLIRRAGLTPWMRTFHNLRSSCETELANRFPAHVVAKWLGNSVQVATAHYLQTTDEHFRMAVEPASGALHKALQQGAETGGTGKHPDTPIVQLATICKDLRQPAGRCEAAKYPREDSNL